MQRVALSTFVSLFVVALYACEKPPAETTPPGDTAGAEAPPSEPPPEEPPVDAEAEQKAAAEAEAAAAAEKKAKADEQLAKGKELYGANCASCHGASGEGKKGKGPKVVGEGALPLDPPKGAKMRKGIQFNTAKDVADFVVANMPPKKAGSLTPEEYFAILAFDLSANGIAVAEPVTADNAASIPLRAAAPAAAAPAETPSPAK